MVSQSNGSWVGPTSPRSKRAVPRRLAALGDVPWQVAVSTAALVAATAAVWVTLESDFLAHPGWLAAQKADFILGPVFVGLYWMRQRPESRYGPMLIAFGAVGAVYILHSSSNPWLYSTGLVWELMIYLGSLLLILTFPPGRLDGLAAKLIMYAGLPVSVLYLVVVLLMPQLGADGSISGCAGMCPENKLAVTSNPALAVDLYGIIRVVVIAQAIATAGLLIWRMVTGTPPQRRVLAIGTPIALVFLLCQITYQSLHLVGAHGAFLEWVQWALAGARSLMWYGFLLALVAAQLFAGRALHRLVRQSLRRPSRRELETMLREPLGDPELRLLFVDAERESGATPAGDGAVEVLERGRGRKVTIVERGDGTPGAAINHDALLADDPELLRAAGAVALLAAENAELDGAWNDALHELQRSRARIVVAGDSERRKVERNLHDGVQQRLVAVRIQLELAGERSDDGEGSVRDRLHLIGESVEDAIDELRDVAHGLYPPVLGDYGIVAALEHTRRRVIAPITLRATGIARYPGEIESAVYYCCLEAIQNATKHGGPNVKISITLHDDAGELRFEVVDDGTGFAGGDTSGGTGLQNIRDRVGALDGRVSIVTAVGEGTSVAGTIPLRVVKRGDVRRQP